jgi:hypothetical protein
MPAIGTITINDGAGTPAATAFAPVGISGITASHADRGGGIPVGFPTVDVSLRNPSKESREKMYLATFRVKYPVMDVTSPSTGTGIQPAPSVGYTLIGEVKMWLPERSTLQDRKHIRAFIKNLMSDAVTTNLVETLENVY